MVLLVDGCCEGGPRRERSCAGWVEAHGNGTRDTQHHPNNTNTNSPLPKNNRFANWTGDACRYSEPCTEAQTHTDLTVDLAAVKRLLDSRLPLVWAGRSVQSAELPWPPVES